MREGAADVSALPVLLPPLAEHCFVVRWFRLSFPVRVVLRLRLRACFGRAPVVATAVGLGLRGGSELVLRIVSRAARVRLVVVLLAVQRVVRLGISVASVFDTIGCLQLVFGLLLAEPLFLEAFLTFDVERLVQYDFGLLLLRLLLALLGLGSSLVVVPLRCCVSVFAIRIDGGQCVV